MHLNMLYSFVPHQPNQHPLHQLYSILMLRNQSKLFGGVGKKKHTHTICSPSYRRQERNWQTTSPTITNLVARQLEHKITMLQTVSNQIDDLVPYSIRRHTVDASLNMQLENLLLFSSNNHGMMVRSSVHATAAQADRACFDVETRITTHQGVVCTVLYARNSLHTTCFVFLCVRKGLIRSLFQLIMLAYLTVIKYSIQFRPQSVKDFNKDTTRCIVIRSVFALVAKRLHVHGYTPEKN